MFCRECECQLLENTKECPNCGASVEQDHEQPPIETLPAAAEDAPIKSGEEEAHASNEIKFTKQIADVIRLTAGGFVQLYPEILQEVKEKISKNFVLPKNETVIGFIEEAMWVKGSAGMIIGRHGIYWKDAFQEYEPSNSLTWDEVAILLKKSYAGSTKLMFAKGLGFSTSKSQEIKLLLGKIVSCGRSSRTILQDGPETETIVNKKYKPDGKYMWYHTGWAWFWFFFFMPIGIYAFIKRAAPEYQKKCWWGILVVTSIIILWGIPEPEYLDSQPTSTEIENCKRTIWEHNRYEISRMTYNGVDSSGAILIDYVSPTYGNYCGIM